MSFAKYVITTKLSWSSGFMYRLNFIMWRIRMFIQLLTVYFLWITIAQKNATPFGYEQSILITYIIGSSIMRATVFSSRSIDAQTEVATGELSNYLLKPINYFSYWFARDVADKILNIFFSIIEIIIFIAIFKPPLFIQLNPIQLIVCIGFTLIAALMYFYFSFIVSLTTFWYSEANGWPLRFLVFTMLEFLSGGLFPLDILPRALYRVLQFLPPTYFIFTPMQVYLGKLTGTGLIMPFLIMVSWTLILYGCMKLMWRKGIKKYEAFGR